MSSDGLFPARKPTGSWWRDHSLSLVIGRILLVETPWVLWTGHAEWVSQQIDHGAKAPFAGRGGSGNGGAFSSSTAWSPTPTASC